MRRLAAGLVFFAFAASAQAQKEHGFDNRKGSGQPYLTPAESLARLKVPAEFEAKLFAAEPQVINPVAFSIDERGRIWVVECFEYPSRTPKGKAPRDRIVILEDTDGDGVCDKRTVFAEGRDFPVPPERAKAGLGAFDLATGLEVGHGKVFVGAPPYLWTIEITGANKDKPGKFETPLKGFGSQDTHETLNTFQWGPDGWLYGLQGVFTQSKVGGKDGPETRMNAAVWRYHPTRGTFEIYAEGTSNPWGMDWRNTDGQFILACCVIEHLYHIVPGGVYKRQAGASENPYAFGYIQPISDHTFHKESGWAHAGLISLDAPHIPERFRNSVIFGSIHGCSLKQNILKPHKSSYIASRGDDFLTSGDKNFRPINMKWGPNGDIYLIDWHDQNPCHQAAADAWDYERGRVYRIQVKGREQKKAADLGKLTLPKLLAAAGSADPYTFRTALRLLAEHPVKSFPPPMGFASGADKLPLVRMGWAAAAVGLPELVAATEPPPGDPEPNLPIDEPLVAGWSVRLLTQSPDVSKGMPRSLATQAEKKTAPTFRREIAAAAVRLADKHDVTAILHALMSHKEDATDPLIPHLTWLAYEKVIAKQAKPAEKAERPVEAELKWLAAQAPDNIFVRDQIVPKVVRRLAATGEAADVALCVGFVANVKDVATREKALDGLAAALDRRTVAAPAAWAALQAELQAGGDSRLTAHANRLAVSFRDPAALKRAYDAAHDLKLSSDERAEALRQVVQLRHPDARALVHSTLRQEQDLRVRAEAARQLSAFDDPKIGGETVRDWKMIPKGVRGDVVSSLASRKEWARALLQGLADKSIDRAEVTDSAITRIQAFNDKGLNDLIERAWGKSRATPADLLKTIDAMRGELAAKPGSFARGKAVFAANCAKCHQFEGQGQLVGPALDGAGRDIEYLLANVIDPNRVVGAPYFTRIVNTLDGRVEQGLLEAEDAQSITLKGENGVLKKFAKADLDGPVKVIEKSLMPEGLTATMTAQDFRDLVRYLMVSPFLTDVTVNGKPTSAPLTGQIAVPAGETTITATVTLRADSATQLLLGVRGEYKVLLDGKQVAAGKGEGGEPDRVRVPLTLAKGDHTLTLSVKGEAGSVYARLLDPERVMSSPEAGR